MQNHSWEDIRVVVRSGCTSHVCQCHLRVIPQATVAMATVCCQFTERVMVHSILGICFTVFEPQVEV